MHKSAAVSDCANTLYQQLIDMGYDVLLDDRGERPGVKFADMELMGIPHRIVIGDRGLKNNALEYKGRCDQDNTDIALDGVLDFVRETLGSRA
jgi:prolyl-tRNA synthetase